MIFELRPYSFEDYPETAEICTAELKKKHCEVSLLLLYKTKMLFSPVTEQQSLFSQSD